MVGHSATIAAGEWITATGEWVNDRNHGQQFKARFLRTSAPTSTEGIEKYLSSGIQTHIRRQPDGCDPSGAGLQGAKRMTEATGIEAKTIHRLLEADPQGGRVSLN